MADNITILDSTGTSKAWGTSEGTDSQHRQHVVVTDANGKSAVKLEDAAHASGDAGIMALAVRQDTLAALAGTTGDYTPLTTDSMGALNVATRGGYADGATFTRGSSRLLAGLAGIYESTVSTLTAGKVALARLTSRGAVVTAGDFQALTLANAEAITDTSVHDYTIRSVLSASIGGPQIGMYKWRFSFRNTHDQAANISIYATTATGQSIILYTESAVLSATSGNMIIGPGAVGTGGATTYKQISALAEAGWWDLFVRVQFSTAPTTGAVTVSANGVI